MCCAVAGNLQDRQFRADGPSRKWVTEFTFLWTAEGWLYVAVVLDLYSRDIAGWSMKNNMPSQLVADALMMAVWRRGRPWELLHHVQYEPCREWIMQLGYGKLLLQFENRPYNPEG